MMVRDEIEIAAPAELVWREYSDVERWPEWTTSVTEISMVGGGGLRVGARFRMKQPRMPSLVWVVTELVAGRSWTWTVRSPGATTSAMHSVEPLGDHSTRVVQQIDQSGPIGALVGLLIRRTTRKYLRLEATGLRDRCEAAWASGGTHP